MKRVLLLLVLAGCWDPEDPWPDFPEPGAVPVDPRLGDAIPGFAYAVGQFAGDHYYVAVQHFDLSWHPYELDLSTSPPTPHALPEAPTSLQLPTLGVSIGDAWYVNGSIWDGATWTQLPQDSQQGFSGQVLVRSATEVIVAHELDGALQLGRYFNGSVWSDLSLPPAYYLDAALGPWDDRGIRVIYYGEDGACVAFLAPATNTLGTPTCFGEQSATWRGVFQNGTVDDFTLYNGFVLGHFDGAQLTIGDAVGAISDFAPSLLATPGGPALIANGGDAYHFPQIARVTDGHVGEVLVPRFEEKLECECDRTTDLSCPCVPRSVLPMYAISPAGDRMVLTVVDSVDGTYPYQTYIRSLPLPLTDSPLAQGP